MKKLPGGKTVRRFVKRKPGKITCTKCTKALAGTPQKRPAALKKIPKSARRPERPYGGTLCSACARQVHITKTRA